MEGPIVNYIVLFDYAYDQSFNFLVTRSKLIATRFRVPTKIFLLIVVQNNY